MGLAGRAARAPEPPRATRRQPESIETVLPQIFGHFLSSSRFKTNWDFLLQLIQKKIGFSRQNSNQKVEKNWAILVGEIFWVQPAEPKC
jgi:hypothetical protein